MCCAVTYAVSSPAFAAGSEENGLKPWRRDMWCFPPDQHGQFVARMEQVLDVYARPYHKRPVVCMDEQPIQLTSQTRTPIPVTAHKKRRLIKSDQPPRVLMSFVSDDRFR